MAEFNKEIASKNGFIHPQASSPADFLYTE